MSLSSALSTAVSGLTAESMALQNISKNISNASTTAYKSTDTNFRTMLTGVVGTDVGGGVQASAFTNLAQSGQINSTNTTTNVAIYQAGFFVVAPAANAPASEFAYTRDGSFTTDKAGNLVNNQGFYLQGFATDAYGKVLVANTTDLSNLQPINLAKIGGTAKATTQINFTGNLPAAAAVAPAAGSTFPTSTTMIDTLGISHTINQTWTKTGANAWTLSFSNPVLTSNPTGPATNDTITPSSINVTFDKFGVLQTTSAPIPIALTIDNSLTPGQLSTGAAKSTITFNLGTIGKTDGITQFDSTSATPSIGNPSFTQDGALYGQMSGVTIDNTGLVTAEFDNGVKLPVYQIPLATFPNPNGLTPISGSIYAENQSAGNVGLRMPGEGGAGTVESSALEGSTTDIAGEFNKMIVAQQAYSAASQVVSTVKNMFDTLSQSLR